MDICLILTPRYYRQFSLSLGKALTLSLNSTRLIRTAINPLSPNIQKQILQTDLHTFPYRISWEKLIKDQRFFSL